MDGGQSGCGAWSARVRLACLLGCLAACTIYAVDDHPGAVSALASGGHRARVGCKSFLGAREAQSPQPFADVRALLAAAIPGGAYHVYGGVAVPATLWTGDVSMAPLTVARVPQVYAGYQLWWWVKDSDVGETDAQVLFLTVADADRFVSEEAGTQCRGDAVVPSAPAAGSAPPGSRDVRVTYPWWGYPDTYVFFARGRYGYEASAAGPVSGPGGALTEQRAANRVACALPAAGC